MAKSLNKAQVIGNLGRDPETRYSPSGMAITTFSVACGEKWRDKEGELQEKTEWIRCVAFGKVAEIIEEYAGKGDLVFCEGKIQTRQWEDKDGETKYMTEVVVHNFISLRSKGGPSGNPYGSAEGSGGKDDDIPF